ncbi:MAG: Gluconolaconase [Sphingomonadales bacterium]|nr:Gluconolaconase [Sphingomonadales bacterium]
MQDIHYITDELRFPEGPIALADGSVILVEIERGTLSRVTATGHISVLASPGGGPNGAALGPDGCVYICNNGGFRWIENEEGLRPAGKAEDHAGGRIEKINTQTGEVTRLYENAENGRLSAPNDIVFDRSGGFWFTDTGAGGHRSIDRGGIYYGRPDGSMITEALFPMLQPNGVGLSPAEDVLYVAETVTGRLWAFDIESPGKIARKPWPSPNGGRLIASLPGYRLFDSLAIDADGNIVAATIYEGGIVVISPMGEIMEDIPLPDRFVTNICFGGSDSRTAYITMSQTGHLASMRWSRPGLRLNFG